MKYIFVIIYMYIYTHIILKYVNKNIKVLLFFVINNYGHKKINTLITK